MRVYKYLSFQSFELDMLIEFLAIFASRPENRNILTMIDWIFVYADFVEVGTLGIDDLVFAYSTPFYQFHPGDGVVAVGAVAAFENPFSYAMLVEEVTTFCHAVR